MKQTKQEIEYELTRKRDILATKAILGGLESYIGENITAVQIRKMKKEKLEYYFMLYQTKAGQEVTNNMIPSLVEMSVKGLSYFFNFNNEEDLKKDFNNDLINNNDQIKRLIGSKVAVGVEKYGDGIAIFRHLLIYINHISFSSPFATATPTIDSTNSVENQILPVEK